MRNLKLPALSQNVKLNWLLWLLVVVLPGGSAIIPVSIFLTKHHATHQLEK